MRHIRLSNIIKIKKYLYFKEDFPDYKSINNNIHRAIKRLMVAALIHGSNEALLMIDNNALISGLKHYLITTNNDMQNVAFSYKMKLLLCHKDNKVYTVIHNHPDNSGFSIRDLKTFISWDKLKLMIVCTNSCQIIALLYKSNNIDCDTKRKILLYIDKYMKANKITSDHSPAIGIILNLNKLLQYNEVMNY